MRRMTEPAATVGRARWAFRTAFGSSLMLGVLVSCSDPAVAPFSDRGAEPPAHPALPRATVARVEDFDAAVPQAYYALSLEFSKRTAGFTPPVQARAYAYMGLALYESLVSGMPRHRSIAGHLNGIGALPRAHGHYHWPLVASAAMAEVMRGFRADGNNLHGLVPAGLRIAGLTKGTATGFWWRGAGARVRSASQPNATCRRTVLPAGGVCSIDGGLDVC